MGSNIATQLVVHQSGEMMLRKRHLSESRRLHQKQIKVVVR